MSCKKGGFVRLHHNKFRDITSTLLKEGCHDVAIEPVLQQVAEYNLVPLTTNRNSGTRLDVRARSLWITGQRAFFDFRVFDPNVPIIKEFQK